MQFFSSHSLFIIIEQQFTFVKYCCYISLLFMIIMTIKIFVAIGLSLILAVSSSPLSSLLSLSPTNNIRIVAGQEANTTSSAIEFSSGPVWDEVIRNTGLTPINETHSIVTFVGNGTMTVPDTGEIINMTNNGYGVMYPISVDPETFSVSGREAVYSEDGDTLVMTYHEFIRRDSTNSDGKGIIIAVFDRNSTGVLAPFNGMLMIGTHDDPLNDQKAIVTLWEWQSGTALSPASSP
jgi:hypothetical protein